MNQDEITKDIKHADGMIDNLGLQIVWWKCRSLGLQKKEAQLAEAEKPELRHGDYGYCGEPSPATMYFVNYNHPEEVRPFGISDVGGQMHIDDSQNEFSAVGNIFDDLKALAGPLKDFEYGDITGKISGDDTRPSSVCIGGFWHTIKTAKKLSMYIQRLIFTAEQEAAK